MRRIRLFLIGLDALSAFLLTWGLTETCFIKTEEQAVIPKEWVGSISL